MLVYTKIIFLILMLRNKLNSKHTSSRIVYVATEEKELFMFLYENVHVKRKNFNDLKENIYHKFKCIILKKL